MSDWFAVYTKSRYEKKVAEKLTEKGMSVYCPTQTVLRQWTDRKKKVTVPVFRSYVFVQYQNEQERLAILQTVGVVNFVRYLGKVAIIREQEIEAIRQLLGEFGEVKVAELGIGDEVQITGGSLKGQTGVVRSTDGKKVYLLIEGLGLSLTAEVSSRLVHKTRDKAELEEYKKSKYHF
jgi:transcription antitermination factor NusG